MALTNDMDLLSEKLFGLRTNGGSEFCGAVIGRSLSDLKWSNNQNDLKMIYIAGNRITSYNVCYTKLLRAMLVYVIRMKKSRINEVSALPFDESDDVESSNVN